MKLQIPIARITILLCVIVGTVLCAYLAGVVSTVCFDHDHLKGLIPMFQLDSERNVPAYVSTMLLGWCAFLLLLVTGFEYRTIGKMPWAWFWLSLIFWYLSADENIGLHERVGGILFSLVPAFGKINFCWLSIFVPLVLIVGIAYLRFVLRLPQKTRFLIIGAGLVYIAGAVGFETLGMIWYPVPGEGFSVLYAFLVFFEESFEMLGLVIFSYALMYYLRDRFHDVVLEFK